MSYKADIISSNRELTTREKIKFTEIGDTQSIDSVCPSGGSIDIDIDTFVILQVHNDKAQNPDYKVCIVSDKGGNKYKTGSETFMETLTKLYEELKEADELDEGFVIKAYKKPSKNFSGEFITCTLA